MFQAARIVGRFIAGLPNHEFLLSEDDEEYEFGDSFGLDFTIRWDYDTKRWILKGHNEHLCFLVDGKNYLPLSSCVLDHESVVEAYMESDPKSGLIIDYLFRLLEAEAPAVVSAPSSAPLPSQPLELESLSAASSTVLATSSNWPQQPSILFKEASDVVDDDESLALARSLQYFDDAESAQRLYKAELAAYRATDACSLPQQWSRRRGARVSDAVASPVSRPSWPRRELEQFRRDKARLAAQDKKAADAAALKLRQKARIADMRRKLEQSEEQRKLQARKSQEQQCRRSSHQRRREATLSIQDAPKSPWKPKAWRIADEARALACKRAEKSAAAEPDVVPVGSDGAARGSSPPAPPAAVARAAAVESSATPGAAALEQDARAASALVASVGSDDGAARGSSPPAPPAAVARAAAVESSATPGAAALEQDARAASALVASVGSDDGAARGSSPPAPPAAVARAAAVESSATPGAAALEQDARAASALVASVGSDDGAARGSSSPAPPAAVARASAAVESSATPGDAALQDALAVSTADGSVGSDDGAARGSSSPAPPAAVARASAAVESSATPGDAALQDALAVSTADGSVGSDDGAARGPSSAAPPAAVARASAAVESSATPGDAALQDALAVSTADGSVGSDDGAARGSSSPAPPAAVARASAAVESSATPGDAALQDALAVSTADGSVGSDDGAARGPSSAAPLAAVARASAAVESSATPGDAALQDALAVSTADGSVGSDDGAARGPSSAAPLAAVARASAAVESSATPGDAALQDALAVSTADGSVGSDDGAARGSSSPAPPAAVARASAAVESSATPGAAALEQDARAASALVASVGSDDGAARGSSSPAPPAAVARASAAVESSATPGAAALEQDALAVSTADGSVGSDDGAARGSSSPAPPAAVARASAAVESSATPGAAALDRDAPAASTADGSVGSGDVVGRRARGDARQDVILDQPTVAESVAPDHTSLASDDTSDHGINNQSLDVSSCLATCCSMLLGRVLGRDIFSISQDMGGAPPVGEGDHAEQPTAPAAPPTAPDATPPEPGILAPRTPTPPPAAPMDTEPIVAPTIEPSGGPIPKKEGRWDHAEHEAFLRCLDEFDRDYSKFVDRIPTRELSQIRSHAQKYFLALSKGQELDKAATDRVAAAVAAAEAAMANEGGEPPTASVQAFMYQQARSTLVQKAAVVGGEDFKARFGENPQWSPEVGRYIWQNLIGKIDSDRCLRGKFQFLVGFDFGTDACQCCGRGVGQGTPAWRQQFISGELRKVKAAAEKAERDAGNLVDPAAVARAERVATEKLSPAAAARQAALDNAKLEALVFLNDPDDQTAESEAKALVLDSAESLFWLARAEAYRFDYFDGVAGDARELIVAVDQASQAVIDSIIPKLGRSANIFSSDDVRLAMRNRDEAVAALLQRRVDDANRALSVAESAVLHATADEVEAAQLERVRLMTVRDQAENRRHVASSAQQLAVSAESHVERQVALTNAAPNATTERHRGSIARATRALVVAARRYIYVVVQLKDDSVLTKAYGAVKTAQAALDAAIQAYTSAGDAESAGDQREGEGSAEAGAPQTHAEPPVDAAAPTPVEPRREDEGESMEDDAAPAPAPAASPPRPTTPAAPMQESPAHRRCPHCSRMTCCRCSGKGNGCHHCEREEVLYWLNSDGNGTNANVRPVKTLRSQSSAAKRFRESPFYKKLMRMPRKRRIFEMLKKVGAPAVKVLTPEHLHKTWRATKHEALVRKLCEKDAALLSGLVKVLVAIDQEGQSNRRVRPWDIGSVATDVQTRTNIDLAHETTHRGGQLSHDKLTALYSEVQAALDHIRAEYREELAALAVHWAGCDALTAEAHGFDELVDGRKLLLLRFGGTTQCRIYRADFSLAVDVLAEILELDKRGIRPTLAHLSLPDARGENAIILDYYDAVEQYLAWAEAHPDEYQAAVAAADAFEKAAPEARKRQKLTKQMGVEDAPAPAIAEALEQDDDAAPSLMISDNADGDESMPPQPDVDDDGAASVDMLEREAAESGFESPTSPSRRDDATNYPRDAATPRPTATSVEPPGAPVRPRRSPDVVRNFVAEYDPNGQPGRAEAELLRHLAARAGPGLRAQVEDALAALRL